MRVNSSGDGGELGQHGSDDTSGDHCDVDEVVDVSVAELRGVDEMYDAAAAGGIALDQRRDCD